LQTRETFPVERRPREARFQAALRRAKKSVCVALGREGILELFKS